METVVLVASGSWLMVRESFAGKVEQYGKQRRSLGTGTQHRSDRTQERKPSEGPLHYHGRPCGEMAQSGVAYYSRS